MSVPAPDPEIARLIGQYGGSESKLDVFEDAGRLHAQGHGFAGNELDRIEASTFIDTASARRIVFGPDGKSAAVDAMTLYRRDFGAEAIADFQHSLRATPKLMLEDDARLPEFGTAPLVSIARALPSIALDIRYAGTDNFMGRRVYDRPCAYARPAVIAALAQVQEALSPSGYGLIVYDAYRPWSVTKLFWDAVPPVYRGFVADPALGSKHNRGCAVDLTLSETVSGLQVDMPSRYDEPTERSHADYRGGTSRQRWHRDLLRATMEAHGFMVQPDEWWHFDFHDWQDYPVEDTPFAALPD